MRHDDRALHPGADVPGHHQLQAVLLGAVGVRGHAGWLRGNSRRWGKCFKVLPLYQLQVVPLGVAGPCCWRHRTAQASAVPGARAPPHHQHLSHTSSHVC